MPRVILKKEIKKRQMRFRIAAGVIDFAAIVIGVVVIIALVILLGALIRWILAETGFDLASLWRIFMDAIIMPGK